jgi:ferritin-like protein
VAHEGYHEASKDLSADTRDLHRALVSLMEELEAVDWYRQRADAGRDEALREVLLHNMHEEMEHAAMLIEWLRRNNDDFAAQLADYLFTDVPLTHIEDAAADGGDDAPGAATPRCGTGTTIGSLKES